MLESVRQSVRSLRRSGSLYGFLILLIALGLGPAVGVFSVVNLLVLGNVDLPGAKDLVVVTEHLPAYGEGLWLPTGSYIQLQEMTAAFQSVAAFMTADVTLAGRGQPQRVHLARVTPSFFTVVQVHASHGRTFEEADARLWAAENGVLADTNFVLLSDRLWQSLFGGDPAVIHSSLDLDGRQYQVLGVMPAGFGFPEDADLWSPLGFGGLARGDWGGFFLQTLGRLHPGKTLANARQQLEGLASRASEAAPHFNQGISFEAHSLRESLLGERDKPLLLIFLLALVILAGALVNATQLLVVRSTTRYGEAAVRSALGASRKSLLRLFWIDGLAVAVPGALLGCVLAFVGVTIFNTQAPLADYGFRAISLNGQVLVFAVLLTLVSSAVLGFLPAVLPTRPSVLRNLRGGEERLVGSQSGRSLQRTLIALQLLFSLSLVSIAILFSESFLSIRKIDYGFATEDLLTVDLTLPAHAGYRPSAAKDFVIEALDRLGQIPGVLSVAECLRLPVLDSEGGIWYRVPGEAAAAGGVELATTFNTVSAGYFETLRLPIVSGRGIQSEDREGGEAVAVIDELLARRHFGVEDPVGKYLILTAWPEQPRRIVGVAKSVPQGGLRAERLPAVYVPFEQVYLPTVRLVLRTSSDRRTFHKLTQEALWEIDPNLAFDSVAFFEDRLSELLGPEKWAALLASILGFFGLVLSASCVYATTSHLVHQRRRDFGIRLALGATPDSIFRYVIRVDLAAVLIGLGSGVVFCFALARFWRGMLFQVDPLDPILLGISAILLAALVVLAMFLPARRASLMDPKSSLE
jgi:putative ABC transport system permease protein